MIALLSGAANRIHMIFPNKQLIEEKRRNMKTC